MSNMGFFSTKGQVSLKVNSLIGLESDFFKEFMPVLVFCKVDKDLIKMSMLHVVQPRQHFLHLYPSNRCYNQNLNVTDQLVSETCGQIMRDDRGLLLCKLTL